LHFRTNGGQGSIFEGITDGFEAVEEAEVEAAVDKDAGAGDPEAAVQPFQPVRSTQVQKL
jgi:hypothetical protein